MGHPKFYKGNAWVAGTGTRILDKVHFGCLARGYRGEYVVGFHRRVAGAAT
jgi:hypothetical protein